MRRWQVLPVAKDFVYGCRSVQGLGGPRAGASCRSSHVGRAKHTNWRPDWEVAGLNVVDWRESDKRMPAQSICRFLPAAYVGHRAPTTHIFGKQERGITWSLVISMTSTCRRCAGVWSQGCEGGEHDGRVAGQALCV